MPKSDKEKILDLGKELNKLKKPINKLNFFKVVDIPEQELVHSAFIAWLLDSKESHNLGNVFLEKFLDRLYNYQLSVNVKKQGAIDNSNILNKSLQAKSLMNGVSVLDFIKGLALDSNIDVNTEVSFTNSTNATKKDRMDILIKFEDSKVVLVVENKYNAKLAKDQLQRYENTLAANYGAYDKIYVYLRKDDSLPEDNIMKSKGTYNSNWCMFDYNEIFVILDDIYNHPVKSSKTIKNKNKLNNILEDYMSLINPTNSKDVGEVCREILGKNDNVVALDMLNEYRKNERETFDKIFDSIINDSELIKRGLTLIQGSGGTDNSINFYTTNLKQYYVNCGSQEVFAKFRVGTGDGIQSWFMIDKGNALNSSMLSKINKGAYDKKLVTLVKKDYRGLSVSELKNSYDLDKNLEDLKNKIIEIDNQLPYCGAVISSVPKHGITIKGCVHGSGFETVGSNGKPSGEISFDLADGRCGKPDPVPVLKVTADFDGDVYLRSSSAGDYCYKTFDKAPVYTGAVSYNAYFIKRDIMNNNGIAKNKITVELEPYITKFLYPCDAFGNKKNAVVDDVDVDGDIGVKHTYTLDMIKQNWAMELNPVSSLATIENNYRAFVYANYLKVPEHTRDVIDKIFSEHDYWKKGTGVLPAMDYICTYFKYGHKPDPEYIYSYDFKIPDEVEDYVTYFLTGGTDYKGVCRQFASAATMMFRVFGIPARMTGGYHCTVNNGVPKQVTSCDAHAWVEVYNDGLGWIIVDPTP